MRELKFLAYHKERGIITNPPVMNQTDGTLICQAYIDGGKLVNLPLMQYTGVKDKNGREIYEDFIVRLIWVSTDCYGYIKFHDGAFALFDSNHKRITTNIGAPFSNSMVIVGNIHENKDLLEWK